MDKVERHMRAFLDPDPYCHRCGARLTYTEIGKSDKGDSRYHIKCPGCGWENRNWTHALSVTRVVAHFEGKKAEEVAAAHGLPRMRLSDEDISEKIRHLTFPAYVLPSLQPRLLLSSFWFGEGIKRLHLPKSPIERIRVVSKAAREAIRKGHDRSRRISAVLWLEQARREPGARYVEFHARYEGPEYDAATERLCLQARDSRAPEGFGKPVSLDNKIRTQLLNFLPFGPPGAFQRDFHAQQNRYFNEKVIMRAPITDLDASLRSGAQVRWVVRHFEFVAPLAHAHTSIGPTEVSILAVGEIADDLETVLPTLMRLEPDSSETTMLAAGQTALMQHRLARAQKQRESQSQEQ